jgi:hypothetical protein
MTPPEHYANDYGARLLRDAGYDVAQMPVVEEHPALAWASSGLMDMTGHANGPALMSPVPITSAADGALAAFATLANAAECRTFRGASLLGQRGRLMQLRRNGRTSPGGACRLMQARDGWIALNLARPDDWASIPALLNGRTAPSWNAIEAAIRDLSVKGLLQRAHWLGLAASRADLKPSSTPWLEPKLPRNAPAPRKSHPVVIDLSTLWAGPLCGQLLHRAGAFVVKIESANRPDGARAGHPGFYDFLNAGKPSVVLDFRQPRQIEMLRRMIERADIVIESARPRALRQLGLTAESLAAENPGLTWVSITGYGRNAANEDRVGYGDDSAAAAGLGHVMKTAHGDMVFSGDAIADPLTGLHAAVAAWATWQNGGGMAGLSLHGVAGHCIQQGLPDDPAERAFEWGRLVANRPTQLPLPRAPHAARPLGADTNAVLSDFAVAC